MGTVFVHYTMLLYNLIAVLLLVWDAVQTRFLEQINQFLSERREDSLNFSM